VLRNPFCRVQRRRVRRRVHWFFTAFDATSLREVDGSNTAALEQTGAPGKDCEYWVFLLDAVSPVARFNLERRPNPRLLDRKLPATFHWDMAVMSLSINLSRVVVSSSKM